MAKKLHGVFAWEPENMYRAASAVKVYKLEHAARRHADKLNANWEPSEACPGGYVVREVCPQDVA